MCAFYLYATKNNYKNMPTSKTTFKMICSSSSWQVSQQLLQPLQCEYMLGAGEDAIFCVLASQKVVLVIS